jgi:hypothetical protein
MVLRQAHLASQDHRDHRVRLDLLERTVCPARQAPTDCPVMSAIKDPMALQVYFCVSVKFTLLNMQAHKVRLDYAESQAAVVRVVIVRRHAAASACDSLPSALF